MNDFHDVNKTVAPEVAGAYLTLVDYAINRPEEPLLRARGYLVAGMRTVLLLSLLLWYVFVG